MCALQRTYSPIFREKSPKMKPSTNIMSFSTIHSDISNIRASRPKDALKPIPVRARLSLPSSIADRRIRADLPFQLTPQILSIIVPAFISEFFDSLEHS
jgi:hypothetical protein